MENYNENEIMTGETAETVGEPMDSLSPEELAAELARMLEDKKAFDVKILNLQGKSDICDYFVLATGTSNTHVRALAGDLEYKTGLRKAPPFHIEGRGGNTWMVLDYTTVIVHIFTRETREFYHLEKLYRADTVPVEGAH